MDSSKINIGRHPLLRAALYVSINIFMYIAAFFLMFRGGTISISLGLVMLFFAVIKSYYTFLYALASVVYLRSMYKRTRESVRELNINPSWFINSWGYLVVDETNKKIVINGDAFDYSDIASIERNSQDSFPQHAIIVNINKGIMPVKKISLVYKTEAEQFYQRLINSLNFS